jgi:hypothetical protein
MSLRIVCSRAGTLNSFCALTQILNEGIDVEITDAKTSVCHPHAAAFIFAGPDGASANFTVAEVLRT